MKTILSITALSLLIFSSCSKDSGPNNQTIIGKWKLTETFGAYANGGSFNWTPVPADYSKYIEFFSNGQFTEITNYNGNTDTCSGNFVLSTDSLLQRNTDCSPYPVNRKISEHTPLQIVLDHNVIEGVIKDKYVKVN
jgi:hypothetical protein